jgi:hypothetical protein
MPSVPPEQSAEQAALPPRGPHDRDTRPRSRTKPRAVPPANRSTEIASPHQCQGGSSDEDSARGVLPTYVRFSDLTAAGLVGSWTQLVRMIDGESFPPGCMLSPNVRAWRIDEIEAWLASRPSGRKVMPPGARHPRTRKKAEAGAEA